MEYRIKEDIAFVRLETGEPIIKSLKSFLIESNINSAFLNSGIGMISNFELGFFNKNKDSYEIKKFMSLHDLTLLHGNLTLYNGNPIAHVHIIANDNDFNTVGGHLMEGTCEITLELFLSISNSLNLVRKKISTQPATRIIFE